MLVFTARLYHETNSFAPGTTGLADFAPRSGSAVQKARGDGAAHGHVI